mgnify:CR=1 FL=1
MRGGEGRGEGRRGMLRCIIRPSCSAGARVANRPALNVLRLESYRDAVTQTGPATSVTLLTSFEGIVLELLCVLRLLLLHTHILERPVSS